MPRAERVGTFAIVLHHQRPEAADLARATAQWFREHGHDVVLPAADAAAAGLDELALPDDTLPPDLEAVVSLGGDGTMLGAGRLLAPYKVPLIGINHGRLGFITDIPLQDATSALARVIEGDFEVEDRILLEGRVVRGDKVMFSGLALNDVVINRAGRGGMIELHIELDGSFMYNQRADGLIVSTPTGSTAYALSANGPILHPQLNAIVLVPVAPQTLSNRPIVIPDSGLLSMTITALGRVESGASVHFDMQSWSDCQPGDRIDVRRANDTLQFVHPAGYSFFSTLRRKLHWNRMPLLTDDTE